MPNAITRLLVMLPLLLSLSGCGFIDYFYLPPPEDTAQELFEAGNEAMREKNYTGAVDYFVALKDKYPFSPYTQEAELSLGDAYFLDEEYLLAAEAYQEFEALHPRHEAMPYVLYQIGKSYLDSFVSIDRPQTNVVEALEYFKRLQVAYPGSEYANKAADLVYACRKLIAEHEIYVADFYWRTDKFTSAFQRYKFVLENYSDIEEFQEYARNRARMSFLKSQEQEGEQIIERREGSWKQWFEWL